MNKSLNKDIILLNSLNKFFNKKKNMNKFLKIYNKKSKISLRLLDWFVTNFSKKNNIIYNVKTNYKRKQKQNIKNFIVYLEYKAQLKAYSKKQFDPFCRRERIFFKIPGTYDEIETTIGQLNFFRWAIENNILKYVDNSLEQIEDDMNNSIKKHYVQKKNKKRTQLSISATKQVRKHDVKIIVKFD